MTRKWNLAPIIEFTARCKGCEITRKTAEQWNDLCQGLNGNEALDLLFWKFKGVINGA